MYLHLILRQSLQKRKMFIPISHCQQSHCDSDSALAQKEENHFYRQHVMSSEMVKTSAMVWS